MKVILIDDVPELGDRGQIREVKNGYARNYLLPQDLALKATPGNLKKALQSKTAHESKILKELETTRVLANRISNLSLTIERKAGDEDALFGSVTSVDLADALAAEGIKIDKRKILLEEPIRNLGVYTVEIKLHPEVMATLKTWVVKE